MNLTKLSRSRMMLSASRWTVAREYFDPLYNYLVYGFAPGSFWTAAISNDFMGAMACSHPANDIPSLKNVVGWIRDSWPEESWGSYDHYREWMDLKPVHRRSLLEAQQLIYTEQEEIMQGLKGVEAKPEPILW